MTNLNLILPAIATLAAAFFGVWFAYRLENNRKKREEQDKNINKANDLLFALFARELYSKVVYEQLKKSGVSG